MKYAVGDCCVPNRQCSVATYPRGHTGGWREPDSPARATRISQKPSYARTITTRFFLGSPSRTRSVSHREGRCRVPRSLTAHPLRVEASMAGTAEFPNGPSRSRHVQAAIPRCLDPRPGAGRLPLKHGPEPAEGRSAASVQPHAQCLTEPPPRAIHAADYGPPFDSRAGSRRGLRGVCWPYARPLSERVFQRQRALQSTMKARETCTWMATTRIDGSRRRRTRSPESESAQSAMAKVRGIEQGGYPESETVPSIRWRTRRRGAGNQVPIRSVVSSKIHVTAP